MENVAVLAWRPCHHIHSRDGLRSEALRPILSDGLPFSGLSACERSRFGEKIL
jgi:hypothetical protein